MFKKLFSIILLCAVCSAIPMFDLQSTNDNSESENIRVKRYGFLGGYNSYLNDSPYTYKFKTPFFKVKIKNQNGGLFGNQAGLLGHPPYGFGNIAGSYPPYGIGAFHPPIHAPYGYHHNPYGYGWFG